MFLETSRTKRSVCLSVCRRRCGWTTIIVSVSPIDRQDVLLCKCSSLSLMFWLICSFFSLLKSLGSVQVSSSAASSASVVVVVLFFFAICFSAFFSTLSSSLSLWWSYFCNSNKATTLAGRFACKTNNNHGCLRRRRFSLPLRLTTTWHGNKQSPLPRAPARLAAKQTLVSTYSSAAAAVSERPSVRPSVRRVGFKSFA
jgi:hypothetical protein